MRKAKRNAIVIIIAFLLILGLSVYTAIFGIGDRGKVEYLSLGLDLEGGLSVTYKIEEDDYTTTSLEDTKSKLEKRIEPYSTEYNVYEDGSGKITCEIPGVTNAEEILDQLGLEGTLEFLDPENYELWSSGEEYEAALTGDDIKDAQAGTQETNTGTDNVVSLVFTDEGAKKFGEVTSANLGKIVYIIFDNEIVSAPTVNAAITDGNAVIESISSYEEADRIATTIRGGALPLTLTQVRSNIVGATLGSDAISTSIKAGIIGLIIIFIILIALYRIPGVVASFALALYTFMDLLVFNLFNVTLTLPGIAGILLSIGMAVDANVIIFTRIKEELAAGATVKAAVKKGFNKALSAILDGNITTLIAAFVLIIFGTGSIKGFGRTLAIGIILSVFTALVVTQLLLNALVTLGLKDAKYFGKERKTGKVNYVKGSKFCIIGSVLVMLFGIIMLPVYKNTKGSALNLSIEFAGGTSMTVEFDKSYSLSEAEDEVVPVIAEAAGISEANISVQTVTGTNEIMFKTPSLGDNGEDSQIASVTSALEEKFGATVKESDSISGSVSKEMTRNAIFSVILSAVLMLIYIALRFKDIKFGASAVLALLHDVFIVFVVYIVFRLSVGNSCIACLLTIVGYSINATIVIFDRIRENIAGKKLNSSEDYAESVNLSVNQTFTRSIYTSLTTFVTVFMLFILGVASIKEFAVTIMAGIIVGAYSSICITGPLWYHMKTKLGKKKKLQ